MSKEELLKKEFASAVDAMNALTNFLEENKTKIEFEGCADYQGLYALGNRIYD